MLGIKTEEDHAIAKEHWRRRILTSRIFVVDDEEIVVESTCHHLKSSGFECVRGFSDSISAVESFRNMPPDLIVTDFHMPGMNGDFLIRITRSFPRLWNIPILVLTSDAVTAAKEVGAENVLEKPASRKEIVAAVAKAIAKSHKENRERNNQRWSV